MNDLMDNLPAIISTAAQSYLGILALLCVALTILAFFFFTRASEKVKFGVFVLLFFGVISFGVAMFRAAPLIAKNDTAAAEEKPQKVTMPTQAETLKATEPSRPTVATRAIKKEETRTKDNLVTKELNDKNLFIKLEDAATRLSPDKDSEAILRLYRGVLNDLSPEARSELDQTLLMSADGDFHTGRNFSAIEKYKKLFSGYQ